MIIRGTILAILMVLVYAGNEKPEHWAKVAREDFDKAYNRKPNFKMAKNIILMVGDGMGLPTVTAGRIYKGQKAGQTGEEYKLVFETFENVGLSKTYNLDRQVSDSAGGGDSMLTGIKVNMGTLGVNGNVPFAEKCDSYTEANKLKTILDYALEQGKSVGIVTNTRITHATPGAAYAHTPYRDWETDTDIKKSNVTGCEKLKDIAWQLVMENPNINVLLGGGRRGFLNATTPDPRDKVINSIQRSDGYDLREEWKKEKAKRGVKYAYVETTEELKAVDPAKTDYLFGLFHSNHMSYEVKRDKSPKGEPSLLEMSQKALQILKKNPNGYFALLEGGRIDHAHHDNYAKRALEEAVMFDDTVKMVGEMTSVDDTLTIVTADHSHGFMINGYPIRGNDILGVIDLPQMVKNEESADRKPYLTLSYTTGPEEGRKDLTAVDTRGDDFQQPGCVKMPYTAHGGEDVAIYAQGPMAHMIHTTHESTYIGHVLMYAACIGPYKDNCDMEKRERLDRQGTCGAVKPWSSLAVVAVVAATVVYNLQQ